MKKKKLEVELYWHDAHTDESIYGVYEVKNGKRKFLGGLHFFDYDIIDGEGIAEDEFDERAKDIALSYAEDGGELMTKEDIEDWDRGIWCEDFALGGDEAAEDDINITMHCTGCCA